MFWLKNNTQVYNKHIYTSTLTLLINSHNQLHSSLAPFSFHISVFGFSGSAGVLKGFCQTLGVVHSCQISPMCHLWCLFSLFLFLHPSPLLFFCFYFIFIFFITNIVTGDQSPSSPSSRWPGANYGNRTLGVCTLFNYHFNPNRAPPYCLLLHFSWLYNSNILSRQIAHAELVYNMQISVLSYQNWIAKAKLEKL